MTLRSGLFQHDLRAADSRSNCSTDINKDMRSTSALLAAVPSAAAWLSGKSAESFHIPLHLKDCRATSLRATDKEETSERAFHRSRLEHVFTFNELIDEDALSLLQAREEGSHTISDSFLATASGIQIGIWAAEVCERREDCEVSSFATIE